MNKRNMWLGVVALVVVIAVIVGIVLGTHKSTNKASTTNSYGNTPTSSPSPTSSTPAVNNSIVLTKSKSGIGQYLTDPNDNALYTYSSDTNGVSNCSGSCLATWPPYLDKGSTANLPTNFATIKRSDTGQNQYTYKGLPLYYFASDSKGQVTGNGVGGFTVAKP